MPVFFIIRTNQRGLNGIPIQESINLLSIRDLTILYIIEFLFFVGFLYLIGEVSHTSSSRREARGESRS